MEENYLKQWSVSAIPIKTDGLKNTFLGKFIAAQSENCLSSFSEAGASEDGGRSLCSADSEDIRWEPSSRFFSLLLLFL